MSAAVQPQAAPESGWRIEFKHAGKWYLAGTSMATFDIAWTALDLMHKADAGQPVERRIVKSFD